MQTVIRKWGNSLAVRLPQHVLAQLEINEGATLTLSVEDGVLKMKPSRNKYKLDDLLKNHVGSDNHKETDWGTPVGKEEW
jgi:antitoxin MazE